MVTPVRARLALPENDKLSGSAIPKRNPAHDVQPGVPSLNRSSVQVPEPRAFSNFIARKIDLVPEYSCIDPSLVRRSEYARARVAGTGYALRAKADISSIRPFRL